MSNLLQVPKNAQRGGRPKVAKILTPEVIAEQRAKKTQLKRNQRAKEKAEKTIEVTHRRRQVDLLARQEKAQATVKRVFERRKTIINQREESLMKELRRQGKLTTFTNNKNIERHTKQRERLQARYRKNYEHREKTNKLQTEKQTTLQRKQNPNPKEPFTIERFYTTPLKKYSTHIDYFKVTINKPPIEASDVITGVLHRAYEDRNLVEGDIIRLVAEHPDWNGRSVSTKNTKITGNVNELFPQIIEKVLEKAEYKNVPLSELRFHVLTVKMPRGGQRIKPTPKNIVTKKSVITIINPNDQMCAARAVVTAFANINPLGIWSKNQISNGFNRSRKLQTTEALKLHERSGVEINEYGQTFEDLELFAETCKVQIIVLDADYENACVFLSKDYTDTPEMRIYLLKTGNHFDVIKSITGFLGRAYFCGDCQKPYTHKNSHVCASACKSCFGGMEGTCEGEPLECEDCKRLFFGRACFDHHKKNMGTLENPYILCDERQLCKICEVITHNLSGHICGNSLCNNCWEYVDMATHKCYMLKKICKGGFCELVPTCEEVRAMDKEEKIEQGLQKRKKCTRCKTYTEDYCAYDIETDQSTGIHIPTLIRYERFSGEQGAFDNGDEFCDFLRESQNEGCTFIAHNSKGFDSYFILKNFVERGIIPYVIECGTKIMYMAFKKFKIRFVDSINHISGRLADFPKTFGLEELKKGYFPHLFNIPENQDYVGKIPDISFYNPDQMFSGDRSRFLKWHKERVDENYVFDFELEMSAYCESDVNILCEGMKKYREIFLEIANVDPLQYITIASDVMSVFRERFLKMNEIAVVRDCSNFENYTKESIAWLDWIASKENVEIQHALNGGIQNEALAGFDGFCESSNTVYEFQGCFWHGCSTCYTDQKLKNSRNQSEMGNLQRETTYRDSEIQKKGYNLVTVKSCELPKELETWMETDPREFVGPLDPRDAFFGGRTNITKLTYDFKPGEYGKYVDFVSLYPTVQYSKKYPVGHPEKIYNPKVLDQEWFGFVKCRVEPPKGLYHPVLPVKTICGDSVKLLFPLCRTCSENQQQETCEHSPTQRSFIGTWCTNELFKAVEKGYKVSKIYEVLHFEETTNDLFKGYVNKFLRIKLESSKMVFGPDCKYKSEEEFQKLTKERHGFTLGKIEYNPGMRAIAKLCLNSLWGKFGQRTNLAQTEYVNTTKRYFELYRDNTIDNFTVLPINEEIVKVTYTLKDQFVDNYNNTNIYIAAFTTSHAREMLYEVLDKLGDRVLGYDTDSVWYKTFDGDSVVIETGDSLGDLTDELEGDKIVKWVGSGPKSYAYETLEEIVVCKTKGFTLNYENSLKINFDSMLQMVKGEISQIITERKNAITRDPKRMEIVNKDQLKSLSYEYNKRMVLENYDTVPYGY